MAPTFGPARVLGSILQYADGFITVEALIIGVRTTASSPFLLELVFLAWRFGCLPWVVGALCFS